MQFGSCVKLHKVIWRHPVLGPGGGGGGGCPEPTPGFGAKLSLLPGIWRKVVVWEIPDLGYFGALHLAIFTAETLKIPSF